MSCALLLRVPRQRVKYPIPARFLKPGSSIFYRTLSVVGTPVVIIVPLFVR